MTDPNLERATSNIVRVAAGGDASLSPSELSRLTSAIEQASKEKTMDATVPVYQLPQIRIPATWLMYAAALAVFAIALFMMSWATPPGGPVGNLAAGNTPVSGEDEDKPEGEERKVPEAAVDKGRLTGPDFDFFKYYTQSEAGAEAIVPQYELPLDSSKIANTKPKRVQNLLNNEDAMRLLRENGFVVLPDAVGHDLGSIYAQLKREEVPMVITPDVILHLFHICFDETLKDLEEEVLSWDMLDMTVNLLESQKKGYEQSMANLQSGDMTPDQVDQQRRLGEAYRRNVAYLSVAHKLLGEVPRERKAERDQHGEETGRMIESGARSVEVPDYVAELVDAELKLMTAHEGPEASPIFGYKEDYSQYVPRGHYTRTDLLKKYFNAMMWYGRATFLFHEIPQANARITANPAVTADMADRMTLQAALLANDIEGASIAAMTDRPKWAMTVRGDVTLKDLWMRVYASTAFFVGAADDLTPAEYRSTLAGADPRSLADTKALRKFMEGLEALPLARIYGGTAGITAWGWGTELFKEGLRAVQGMRLMGQRYIPDSEAMGRLVYPNVDKPLEHSVPLEKRFTLTMSDRGPIRGFPRGLDVMHAMGSDRAMELLTEGGDAAWQNYPETAKLIRSEWDTLPPKDWNQNLYYGWLYTLKPLLAAKATRKGYPTYMQTQAFEDRALTAALASWAQLRHDTILYAKQSYTMMAGGGVPREPRVVGFVEPLPEFYARMDSLCRMMERGLGALNILSPKAERRLKRLIQMVERLKRISEEELQNKELSAEDYKYIKDFADSVAWTLKPEYGELDSRALRTDIVADVHTDGNSKQVLEVGTGKLRMCAVAYLNPDGELLVGFGPVLTFHEFKHPMKDRLTDEAWQKMLESGKTPVEPHWIKNFTSR
ncbi:MAG: DUF3160 domain-containing protein [Planctomycetes bacterium]|nr:DUF3160 domain-containing protein [Planctomycetota bacterium]